MEFWIFIRGVLGNSNYNRNVFSNALLCRCKFGFFLLWLILTRVFILRYLHANGAVCTEYDTSMYIKCVVQLYWISDVVCSIAVLDQ